jgi:hypothetical protein
MTVFLFVFFVFWCNLFHFVRSNVLLCLGQVKLMARGCFRSG